MSDGPCRRFILRYSGEGEAPLAMFELLERSPGAKILDRTARMLLVEGAAARLGALIDRCPGWVMSPDVEVPAPDPRVKTKD